jgi:hypothetical protein
MDGSVVKKDLGENVANTAVERVKYLPQQFIENICNNLNSDFEDEIKKMVFSYLPENEKIGKNTFDDLINHLCSGIVSEIELIKEKIHNSNMKIIKLEKKTCRITWIE